MINDEHSVIVFRNKNNYHNRMIYSRAKSVLKGALGPRACVIRSDSNNIIDEKVNSKNTKKDSKPPVKWFIGDTIGCLYTAENDREQQSHIYRIEKAIARYNPNYTHDMELSEIIEAPLIISVTLDLSKKDKINTAYHLKLNDITNMYINDLDLDGYKPNRLTDSNKDQEPPIIVQRLDVDILELALSSIFESVSNRSTVFDRYDCDFLSMFRGDKWTKLTFNRYDIGILDRVSVQPVVSVTGLQNNHFKSMMDEDKYKELKKYIDPQEFNELYAEHSVRKGKDLIVYYLSTLREWLRLSKEN